MTTKISADKVTRDESRLVICKGCGSTENYESLLTLNKATRVVVLCLECKRLTNLE